MFARMVIALLFASLPLAADDKASLDRKARAALALAAAPEPAPAPPKPVADDGTPKIVVGYEVNGQIYLVDKVSPSATDKEIHAVWDKAVDKAKAAMKTSADDEADGEFFISTEAPPCPDGKCPLIQVVAESPPSKVVTKSKATVTETETTEVTVRQGLFSRARVALSKMRPKNWRK